MYINIHIRVYVHTHIRKKFLKHYRWCLRQRRWYACVCVCLRVTWAVNRIASISTECRRPIGCLKLQVICAKEPLITGLFCRKWPIKIRHPMDLRHPVAIYVYTYICTINVWLNMHASEMYVYMYVCVHIIQHDQRASSLMMLGHMCTRTYM